MACARGRVGAGLGGNDRGGTRRGDDALISETSREPDLAPFWNSAAGRLRSHVFRIWTACAVLGGYVYCWLYAPEMLTWWKRTTTAIIEAGCNLLPYPWGDRLEATLGNFGLWVQITFAIVVFRIVVWLVISGLRVALAGRRERSPAVSADDSTQAGPWNPRAERHRGQDNPDGAG